MFLSAVIRPIRGVSYLQHLPHSEMNAISFAPLFPPDLSWACGKATAESCNFFDACTVLISASHSVLDALHIRVAIMTLWQAFFLHAHVVSNFSGPFVTLRKDLFITHLAFGRQDGSSGSCFGMQIGFENVSHDCTLLLPGIWRMAPHLKSKQLMVLNAAQSEWHYGCLAALMFRCWASVYFCFHPSN